jgi:FOG: EAL domain
MYRDFYLFGKNIINNKTKTLDSIELSLRKKSIERGSDYFPVDEYVNILKNQNAHHDYLGWLKERLLELFQDRPDIKFYLNIDHQELEYSETFEFLESMKDFNNSLLIEITEILPFKRLEYFEYNAKEKIKIIRNLGFKVALADVCSGINSLGNVMEVIDSLHRLKFSTRSLKNINNVIMFELISLLDNLCKSFNKDFVVEGVELREWLKKKSKDRGCFFVESSSTYNEVEIVGN